MNMTDLPAGESPDDSIPVAELCKLLGVTPTFYYAEVKRRRAPKPRPAGVPLAAAKAWLAARAEKTAAKAAAAAAARAALTKMRAGTVARMFGESKDAEAGE
jgi:hypothetical protein